MGGLLQSEAVRSHAGDGLHTRRREKYGSDYASAIYAYAMLNC